MDIEQPIEALYHGDDFIVNPLEQLPSQQIPLVEQ